MDIMERMCIATWMEIAAKIEQENDITSWKKSYKLYFITAGIVPA